MRKSLKERGITLVSLVVTIIILLILAGITIASITGDNGLIFRTKKAVALYKEQQDKEETSLEDIDDYIQDGNYIVNKDDSSKTETPTANKELKREFIGVASASKGVYNNLPLSFNIKEKLPNIYDKLTVENFAMIPIRFAAWMTYTNTIVFNEEELKMTYDSSSGILKIPYTGYLESNKINVGFACNIYCYYVE